ncbi:WD40-repeat-containing domain protein [Gongronella butleri]|nr:WD40-repeat-containing domain protein [Gongronella butleri]
MLPSELLLYVFTFCDGETLLVCRETCTLYKRLIDHYDALVWAPCSQHDFQKGLRRRFWALDFPHPQLVDRILLRPLSTAAKESTHAPSRWQDLYRNQLAWQKGHCQARYVSPDASSLEQHDRPPSLVVGSLQEQHFFTSLAVTKGGAIVRSNPTYKSNANQQAMIRQMAHQWRYMEDTALHGIVCHYAHPSSPYIVTGGVDGTVSLWHEHDDCLNSWQAHRGRVLCVSMNDQVVISGGSDGMIRVWDLADRVQQRGSIDISSYLTGDWFQHGVGEMAVNGHLIVCAPDASGPVLIFSILTGSLVYELKTEPQEVAFSRLCLTPYYLLTKGELNDQNRDQVPVHPSNALQSHEKHVMTRITYSLSSTTEHDAAPGAGRLSPYQLARQFAATQQHQQQQHHATTFMPCINVWDLQTGQLAYRLVPPLDPTHALERPSAMSITDIQISPDSAHVFACVEVRTQTQRHYRLCCWDFSDNRRAMPSMVPIDPVAPHTATGAAWACIY